MSLPQYMITDLPQYVHITDRSKFQNSIVQPGAVLIFSQDGTSLTVKLPSGVFQSLSGDMSDSIYQAIMGIIGAASDSSLAPLSCGCTYYKCASVDTSAKTWSGYKAVQQENGGYTFEETVTTGLTYTTITPVVGSIYSADCMIFVGYMAPADTAEIPDSPLLLYMPLQTDVSATTGQTPSNLNGVTFTTNQGIPCAYFDSSAYIDAGDGVPPTQNTAGNVSATFSFWAKLDSEYDGGYTFSNYNTIHFVLYADKLVFSRDDGFSIEANVNATVWHNYTVLFKGSKCFIYIDGVKVAEADNTKTIINTYTFYISCSGNVMSSPRFKGHLTAFRYYDASLSDAEILALAKEFTPTA